MPCFARAADAFKTVAVALFSEAKRRYTDPTLFGAVAQLGERLVCIQEVAGSIPVGSTSRNPLAAVVIGLFV
jgi:hypothetical protein